MVSALFDNFPIFRRLWQHATNAPSLEDSPIHFVILFGNAKDRFFLTIRALSTDISTPVVAGSQWTVENLKKYLSGRRLQRNSKRKLIVP